MKLWLQFIIAGTLACNCLLAETMGIINGGSPAYVALVDNSFTLMPVSPTPDTPIQVAMNSSGESVMTGTNLTFNWAALISPSGQVTQFSNNGAIHANFFSAAINTPGNSIVGGSFGIVIMEVADPLGNASFIDGGSTPSTCGISGTGVALTTAINDSGWIVVGGNSSQNPDNGIYVTTVPPGSLTSKEIICEINLAGSTITGVSLNNSNNVIAGGYFGGAPYAILFNVSESSPVLTQVSFPFAQGKLFGASIAESGTSLVGGQNTLTNAPFAALINPAGQLLPPLSGSPLPSTGVINGVDLVDGFGYGIIAGQDTTAQAAYVAYVDILGDVHPISGLPTGASASISSVSMNAWGTALVGGTLDGVHPYAALIDPVKGVIALDVSGSGVSNINDVSIRNSHSLITPFNLNLSGNNLTFAKYLVRFAPTAASYLSPSVFNGTLSKALESAVPTRNAISVFAADNNLLYLSNSLSEHFRNHRQHSKHKQVKKAASLANVYRKTDRLMVSADQGTSAERCTQENPVPEATEIRFSQEERCVQENSAPETTEILPSPEEPVASEPVPELPGRFDVKNSSNYLWSEIIGAFASQKEQKQTPGFQPSVGGIMIGWDKKTNPESYAGAGVAYTFTHISEKKDAGYSHINQEYLFGYASWMNDYLYFDGVLWLGAFQTHQVRDIDITGFAFKSTSNPIGWQLSPHVEFGYDHAWLIGEQKDLELTIDPFVMVDWANAWQMTYKERGHSPFNAGQKAYYSSLLRTEVGLRFYQTLYFNQWICTFWEKGSYVNKAPFGVGRMNTFLVGSPGSFTVETLTQLQNLGVVAATVVFEPVDMTYPYGSLSYQGEFCSSYQSHQISAEVSWAF